MGAGTTLHCIQYCIFMLIQKIAFGTWFVAASSAIDRALFPEYSVENKDENAIHEINPKNILSVYTTVISSYYHYELVVGCCRY